MNETTPSKSPRTDAVYEAAPRADYGGMAHMTNIARTLEIELGEAVEQDALGNEEIIERGKIIKELTENLDIAETSIISFKQITEDLKQQNTLLLAQIAVKDEALNNAVKWSANNAYKVVKLHPEFHLDLIHVEKKLKLTLINSPAAAKELLDDANKWRCYMEGKKFV